LVSNCGEPCGAFEASIIKTAAVRGTLPLLLAKFATPEWP